MTHTPAPWNVGKHGTPDYAPQYGIYSYAETNDFCIVKGENAEANARLIAAAPELLEALKILVVNCDNLSAHSVYMINTFFAREAIQKAEA